MQPDGPLRQYLSRCPAMPILTVHDVAHAAPLARALVAGGLTVFEVVMRTPAACAAVVEMRAAAPEAVIGMGTLLGPSDVERALAAGASFGVSPGLTATLAAAAVAGGLPWLPGVATAGEVMAARDHGFRELKFFPANGAGGISFLQALAPVFSDTIFCPTGGIRPVDVPAYRKLPNCPTVGGSWVAPPELVQECDWAAITALARAASSLAAG